jgi:predicted nucleic acid-binding protein
MTNSSGNKIIIVDSDALIALLHESDALHARAFVTLDFINTNNFSTCISLPIVLEAATALSKDKNIKRPDLAKKLLFDFASISQKSSLQIDGVEIINTLSKLYSPQTSKNNSPFDFYLLALAKINKISYIFSFDKFYQKNGLILAEDLLD